MTDKDSPNADAAASDAIEHLLKTNPGGVVSTLDEDNPERIKHERMYSKAWQVTLPSGWVAWVDRLDVERMYLGSLGGLPSRASVAHEIERAEAFVRSHFVGPEPVVIPPKVYDPDSVTPILPPLRFAAQISTYEGINEGEDCSWINLIWFAEIDDDKSIKAFVEDALKQIDWRACATGGSL